MLIVDVIDTDVPLVGIIMAHIFSIIFYAAIIDS